VAVNCVVAATAMLAVAGVTAIEVRVGLVDELLVVSEPPPHAARTNVSAAIARELSADRYVKREAIDEIMGVSRFIIEARVYIELARRESRLT